MTITLFTALVFCGSFVAGCLGALTGLGGGIVIVPLLTMGFGVNIKYAIGASLISVIATSSGAAAAFVREGYTNIRIGIFLETSAAVGAIVGAYLTTVLPVSIIALVFGLVLLYSAFSAMRRQEPVSNERRSDPLAVRLQMEGEYPSRGGPVPYGVANVLGGWGVMGLAGCLSGLLGIGSGAVKVLAMDQIMRLPYKVSTTTSNFIIGITAAASAGIYFREGYVDPGLTMPVMLGVLVGALIGSRILRNAHSRVLRPLFGLVVLVLGVQMVWKGLSPWF